ncbi:MAG: F0F1 ATP synthase subunit delta [Bowdeniella nasicola]|nr:F0F1 ATP synthase subunit delta [Bowdeniella nasicola]
MRAASEAALSAAAERWEAVLQADGARGDTFGAELFGVVDTLDETPSLARALTDPARTGQDKAELASTVFSGTVSGEVSDLIAGMVRSRWSATVDLADALAQLAISSVLSCAAAHDRLVTVENEVFQLDRMLVGQRELRMALADRELPAERRIALVDALVKDTVSPETYQLVRRFAGTLRGRTVPQALTEVGRLAAARRDRVVATVTTAVPPTREQMARLSEILSAQAGQEVHINIDVDPAVLGGMRVHMGSDVVDSTIRARLEEAGRAISG